MKIKDAKVRVKAGPADGLSEGQFTAYASVFGNVDSYGDVVVPGAFADTLTAWAGRDAPIPLLFGHRMDDPDYNIGHVIQATEDDRGLLVTAELDLDNPKAAQVYRLLKGKRIEQMSFAYDVIDGGPVKKDGEEFFELRALDLFEVSVVPLGANAETEILAVKAAREIAAKAGRVVSAKNESALREALVSLEEATAQIRTVLAVLGEDPDDDSNAAPAGDAKAKDPARGKAKELNPTGPADLSALQLIELAALAAG